jgi:UDP-glucose:(heptosyl)LPS alpha-1,3-glucosyltransferase
VLAFPESEEGVRVGNFSRQKRLKVAVLVKSFITTGGSERYAVEITRRLRDWGHDIHLFARRCDEKYIKGISFYQVPSRRTFSSVVDSFYFAKKVARMLEGKEFDVIHSHERGWQQDVLTVHTSTYKSGLYKYSLIRRLDQTYLSYRSWLYLWMERRQMRTSHLVAVSEVIRQDIARYYNRTEDVAVIPPGVDIEFFHPSFAAENREQVREEENISSDDMVVIFVGAEFRRKGLDCLIPAIGPGMRLLVIGRGERMNHYRDLAVKCGAADRVHFVGHVEDVRRYYAAADVFVLPSLFEGFGMTILEAMACGLPVVSSRNTGGAGLIENGRNGFVFHTQNEVPGILQNLIEVDLRKRIGHEARKTAEEYNWDKEAARYEGIYYRIAERGGSRC